MLKNDPKDNDSIQLKDACELLLSIIHPWQSLRMVCFYPTQFLLHNAISRFPNLQHVYQTTKNARICVLDHLSTVKGVSFVQAVKSKTTAKRKSKAKQGKAEKQVDHVIEAEVEFSNAMKELPGSTVITSTSFGAEHTTRSVAIANRAHRDK